LNGSALDGGVEFAPLKLQWFRGGHRGGLRHQSEGNHEGNGQSQILEEVHVISFRRREYAPSGIRSMDCRASPDLLFRTG
jgi:hypothetical protein